MESHAVGKSITAFRERTGMSQGELGKRLNVSAQAVSRWEHGGMPDASLIPDIAKVIGCTLDELYAISSAPTKSTEEVLAQDLQDTPPEKRMARAVQLAWHIMKLKGSTVIGYNSDMVFNTATSCEESDLTKPAVMGGYPTNCCFNFEDGFAYASVSSKSKYVLLMEEPTAGYPSAMGNLEDYQKLFAVFGKKHRLAVFLLGYALPTNKLFTCNYVCAQLGLSQEQAQSILDELCSYCLLNYSSIQNADGSVDAYTVPDSLPIVPFLYFAELLMRSGKRYCMSLNLRNEPLFRKNSFPNTESSVWDPTNSKNVKSFHPLTHHKDSTQ